MKAKVSGRWRPERLALPLRLQKEIFSRREERVDICERRIPRQDHIITRAAFARLSAATDRRERRGGVVCLPHPAAGLP